MPTEHKACAVCGRTIERRRKWADDRTWSEVRYCSKACRSRKLGPDDQALEAAIVDLLGARAGGATICPGEAARAVFGSDEDAWRPRMEDTRRAARRLVAQGRLEIVQKGRAVDPSTARGPIRLRLPR